MHRQGGGQAVREGPHSNSVGFLLHNTMAYVTTIKTIRPVAQVKAQTRLCARFVFMQMCFGLRRSDK